MTHTFQSLGLNPRILATLDDIGYKKPTAIQAETIPLLLDSHDVMGQAQTGTGKTAAFTLPTIQQLNGRDLEMLVLTPTRELAIQVSQAIYRYGSKLGVRVLPIYGGQSYDRQERRLRKGVNVVVGTPGRTLDLIQKRILNLENIRFMVLDEADEMLRMGFIEDVEAILDATDKYTRQTLLFSATFSPDIRRLAKRYMNNPQEITIEASEVTNVDIQQRYYMVNHNDKIEALSRILEYETRKNTLVFTRTRVGSAELAEKLAQRGLPAIAIHGDLAQNERERILNRFRNGQLNILVATDVVGRGVDLPDLTHVINFDMPQMPNEYVHRIGRTGRAGQSGEAITFVTSRQKRKLRDIEKYIDRRIEKAKLPTAADVRQKREDDFIALLVEQIEKTDAPHDLLETLLERGYPAEQVASALIALLAEREFAAPVKEISDVRERSRTPKKRKSRRNSKHSHEAGMVRLILSAGRQQGVRPGDVVRGIASSANIPGSAIGAIRIGNTETYVDIPQQHVDAVLDARGSRVRGQQINVTRS